MERIGIGGNENSWESSTKDLAADNQSLHEGGGRGNGNEAKDIMEIKWMGVGKWLAAREYGRDLNTW